MTEAEIQNELYGDLASKGHKYCVPNCFIFGGNESDMVSVTSSLYIWEYEIKISRSDYYADKKKHRHWRLMHLEHFQNQLHRVPNRFYYVTPEDLLIVDNIPEYAGLIEIYPYKPYPHCPTWWKAKIKKRAPLLHKTKIREKMLLQLGGIMSYRYWGLRCKVEEATPSPNQPVTKVSDGRTVVS